jgi:hypothetical protein
MAKPLPAEVLALIPNGIENLTLRCVICGEALPSSRRTIGDHAGACHKVRVLYRRFIIQLTKCISCLHPATPEEREEFKRWRHERGDLRGRGSRNGGRRKRFTTETQSCGENQRPEPEKTLDKGDDDLATPSVVVEAHPFAEKAQGIV